jgi:hypothetical protein
MGGTSTHLTVYTDCSLPVITYWDGGIATIDDIEGAHGISRNQLTKSSTNSVAHASSGRCAAGPAETIG